MWVSVNKISVSDRLYKSSEADIFVVRKFIRYQKFADSFNL